MDVDPKAGRVCCITFDRNAIVKLLSPMVIDCIDGELPKVVADGFQWVGGIEVVWGEGRGLLPFHKRHGIWSWGHDGRLDSPKRWNILPWGKDAKVDEELAHLF